MAYWNVVGGGAQAPRSSLADFAGDPAVVAYLKALAAQAQQQPAPPSSTQIPQATNTTEMPWDAQYASDVNSLNTGLSNTLASIEGQRPGLMAQYGFNAQGQVDPNNPFGQAQMLQRAYQQRNKGLSNSYASRGQLYSGALQNAKNNSQFDYQAADSGLRSQYSQQQAALAAQAAQARNAAAQGLSDAGWNRVNSAIDGHAAGMGASPTPAGSFASYGDNPAVVAYLKALQAQQIQRQFGREGTGLGILS